MNPPVPFPVGFAALIMVCSSVGGLTVFALTFVAVVIIAVAWAKPAAAIRIIGSQWICNRCGSTFDIEVPISPATDGESTTTSLHESAVERSKNASRPATAAVGPAEHPTWPSAQIDGAKQQVFPTSERNEKNCKLCGAIKPCSDFSYGNRTNNSYCRDCSRDYARTYAAGGLAATNRLRKSKKR